MSSKNDDDLCTSDDCLVAGVVGTGHTKGIRAGLSGTPSKDMLECKGGKNGKNGK